MSIQILSVVDHILKRPNMYFGKFEETTSVKQLFDLTTQQIISKKVKYSPSVLKLFDEAITNSTDNIQRSKTNPTTKIWIEITDNYILIKNNGKSLSLQQQINPIDGKNYYTPELAFGYTYTSSNYNDEEERLANGMNGIGIKLANIYSKQFEIEIVNKNQKYQQIFKNNMSEKTIPKITKANEEESVQIKFYPDFEKLKCSVGKIDEVMKKILIKRIFDSTLFPVDIYLKTAETNDFIGFPRLTFQEYFNKTFLFESGKSINQQELLIRNTKLCQVILFPFRGGKIVSLINNIITENNGNHVKYVLDKIIEIFEQKKLKFTKTQIESNICLYINLNVDKPTFTSQSKDNFSGKIDSNSKTLFNRLAQEICQSKTFLDLLQNKKITNENKKIKKQKPIFEKLTEANLAGTSESLNCTLFVTEGDSATGMVQQCFSSLGHDYYGIYTLGGKPLNIRKQTDISKQMNNRVIRELLTTLGVEYHKDYRKPENLKNLRYGKLVCVKDADTDGSAIMMLVCNIIDVVSPSLLEMNNFFYEFITPQIKLTFDVLPNSVVEIHSVKEIQVTRNNKTELQLIRESKKIPSGKNVITTFNNKAEFNNFMNFNRSKLQVKEINYYKGLAAISTEDALDYWTNYSEYLIPFIYDNQAKVTLNNTFSGENSCIIWRKQLVQNTTEDTYCVRIKSGTDITQYCYYDYAPYAREDCERTIPNSYDGLKPVQRKILYSLLIHSPSSEKFKKVFQIATQASLDGNYHHGDQSINEATCGMMQNYLGANNIPLVSGSGQIGTRFANGKDHGATRYIEGCLSKISRTLFPKVDDQLLKQNVEDEVLVEPKFYIPILPLVLINGTNGVGVGFSTYIPNHSWEDCLRNLIILLTRIKSDNPNLNRLLLNHNLEISPSYPGFKGTILFNEVENSYETYGISKFINPLTYKHNKKDSFWKTTKVYNSEFPELNYDFAFIEISEIPIDPKISMNGIIEELKSLQIQRNENKKKQEPIKITSAVFNKNNLDIFVDYQDNSYNGNELQEEKISLILKIKNNGKLSLNSVPEIIKLSSSLSMRNMMLYSLKDGNLMLRKFNTIKEIFNEFFVIRFEYYRKRKDRLIFLKEEEIKYLSNKIRFLKEITVDKILDIHKYSNQELNSYLLKNKYDTKDKSYKYLTSIPIGLCTKTEYEKLLVALQKKQEELEELKKKLLKDFWLEDLEIFEKMKIKLDEELKEKKLKRQQKMKK